MELAAKHDDRHPGMESMKIAFLGETSHPNAQIWIRALQDAMPCEIVMWSLPTVMVGGIRSGECSRGWPL